MEYCQPHQLDNAKHLARVKGIAAAARYMRACGWPCWAAIAILTGGRG